MRKQTIFSALLCALLLLWPLPALAVDLPIDIDAIGQMGTERQREAVTARFNIDLFSESAEAVNTALAEQVAARQEALTADLFRDAGVEETSDIDAQVLYAATASALFAEPLRVTRTVPVESAEDFPLWLIAVILLISAGGGYLIARAVAKGRERGAHVSHTEH